ncbi:MAG: hypothetical protein ACRC5M_01050 [Anaeroplasmataceae bacterium]
MKTLILCCSPRVRFSTSFYIALIYKFFSFRKTKIIRFKQVKDLEYVKTIISDYDKIIFTSPVYVDTIPSTTLRLLESFKTFMIKSELSLDIYSILNCGFYEPQHCDLAINTFKIWSDNSSQKFKGALGIGTGVMFGFMRLMPIIAIVISIIEYTIFGIVLATNNDFSFLNLFTHYIPYTLIIMTALTILFSIGVYLKIFIFARKVNSNNIFKNLYSKVSFCPRFLFVFMASIYWVLMAFFCYLTLPYKLYYKKIDSKQTNKI